MLGLELTIDILLGAFAVLVLFVLGLMVAVVVLWRRVSRRSIGIAIIGGEKSALSVDQISPETAKAIADCEINIRKLEKLGKAGSPRHASFVRRLQQLTEV